MRTRLWQSISQYYKQYTGILKINTEMTCYKQYTGVLKFDTEVVDMSAGCTTETSGTLFGLIRSSPHAPLSDHVPRSRGSLTRLAWDVRRRGSFSSPSDITAART
jgi:hypothetical protein